MHRARTLPTICLLTERFARFLHKKLRQAAVSRIVIERAWNSLRVTIHTARPGVVIGRKGAEIEKMTDEISRLAGGKQVKIDIIEIKAPDIEAQLVAENVASQLERRISFRRAMKRAVQLAMEQGALGIKLRCSGRLGGAEIARTEWYREGQDSSAYDAPADRLRLHRSVNCRRQDRRQMLDLQKTVQPRKRGTKAATATRTSSRSPGGSHRLI